MTPEVILEFWFQELSSRQWFKVDPELDRLITMRFGETHRAGSCCELSTWRCCYRGRLAEIIVLDQFSRNIYRDTPMAFAQDALALALAQEAVDRGVAAELPPHQRAFLYMPYMHSESRLIHQQALRLFSEPELKFNLEFERRHKAIIDRFGRYPHRNRILDRASTPEEQEFLRQPGSSF